MRAFAFLAVVLLAVSVAFAQNVFHPAGEIQNGTFGSAVGGGNYTFDESLVIADKLGIGTATPSQKLDVNGTVQMIGFKLPTGASNGYVLTSDVSGVGTWQAATGGITGSGTTNYIPKFTAGTTLGNSIIYDNGSNVGIGTTSPAATLDVRSGTNAILNYPSGSWAAKIFMQIDSPDSGGLVIGNRWYATASKVLDVGSLYGGGSAWQSFFTVTGNGNVGISTPTPSQKLDVNGTMNVDSSVTVGGPTLNETGVFAFWNLDESAGTTAYDLGPARKYNGTFTGNAAWAVGKSGSGVVFDGLNDSISLAGIPAVSDTSMPWYWGNPMTIEAWVKPVSFNNSGQYAYNSVVGVGCALGYNDLEFYYSQSGYLGAVHYWNGAVPYSYGVLANNTPLTLNQWNHVAFVKSSGNEELYVNGVDVGNGTFYGTGTNCAMGGSFVVNIGKSHWSGYNDTINGTLDEVIIYSRALTANEIKNDYQVGRAVIFGVGTKAPTAVFTVAPPPVEAIAAGATITANACGTIKQITALSAVTTSTTNTFTAPDFSQAGCCMTVHNVGITNAITLDANSNFKTSGAGNIAVGPYDSVVVCSTGTYWFQATALLAAS